MTVGKFHFCVEIIFESKNNVGCHILCQASCLQLYTVFTLITSKYALGLLAKRLSFSDIYSL